jgi:hypothetical protein
MTRNSPSAVPWLRLTAQGVAIVASILLAFAIDAWWQGRLGEGEKRQILVSLQNEFEIHRSTLIERELRWTERETSIVRLLQLMQSGEFPGPAVMDTLVDDLTYPGTWDPGSGARDALIASGRLELIDNLELRNQLSEWQGRVDEVRDNEAASREMILRIFNPFLSERGVPMDRVVAHDVESWPAPLTSDADAARAYRAILADPTFASYAAVRYAWLNLDEYRETIVFADSILQAIESELLR